MTTKYPVLTTTFSAKEKMQLDSINIDFNKLSQETKEFIGDFKHLSQDKYDKVVEEVSKGPVTVPKVKWVTK